jgi:hypothetical protein
VKHKIPDNRVDDHQHSMAGLVVAPFGLGTDRPEPPGDALRRQAQGKKQMKIISKHGQHPAPTSTSRSVPAGTLSEAEIRQIVRDILG